MKVLLLLSSIIIFLINTHEQDSLISTLDN